MSSSRTRRVGRKSKGDRCGRGHSKRRGRGKENGVTMTTRSRGERRGHQRKGKIEKHTEPTGRR